jgi:short-subunit dehydrogenase
MAKTIAVFGAGVGLGAAVVRRFGREGYRAAVIARRPTAVAALADQLIAEGFDAAPFVADLSEPGAVEPLLASIRDRFETIDVVEYAPISTAPFVPALELDADQLRSYLNLYVFTPKNIIDGVLPEMFERGDGAILVGHGASALHPLPFMSGVGPAMAAMRNYLISLHGETAPQGVYVGTLAINAMILGSAGHHAITSGALPVDTGGAEIPTVDPSELAELYWQMMSLRDRVEVLHPAARQRGPHQ